MNQAILVHLGPAWQFAEAQFTANVNAPVSSGDWLEVRYMQGFPGGFTNVFSINFGMTANIRPDPGTITFFTYDSNAGPNNWSVVTYSNSLVFYS